MIVFNENKNYNSTQWQPHSLVEQLALQTLNEASDLHLVDTSADSDYIHQSTL